jgi:23S rRNA (cytosine1962-C5)-methyltransferase
MPAAPLELLPPPADRRVAVRCTPDALRQVRGGHPWLFAASITSVSHEGRAGDLAVVFDEDRRFAAIGLWDPASPIRLRVLHRGKPAAIDAAWFRSVIDTALARRQILIQDPSTTAFRCIHGENDGFPGLVADRYADTLVVKLYTAAWIPHLPVLVPLLVDATAAETVVLRLSRNVAGAGAHGLADGDALVGSAPLGAVPYLENGLRFEAAVVGGHKTGAFLDQRDNRAMVRSLTAGARVLDVFSYNGGFSLYAAAGGARAVHSVDQSEPALAAARATFARNRDDPAVASCRHATIAGDAFTVLRDLAARRERFEVVIVDPPSFAQKQADVERGRRAYAGLTRLALAVLTPGGLLMQASCSARIPAADFFATVLDAAAAESVPLVEVARTGHPIDHPIGFPEGAYLKALFARTAGARKTR